MNKYLKTFRLILESEVKVDLICKDWNERFAILKESYRKDDIKYTFIINSKRKDIILSQTKITEKQALEIISNLSLLHVKSDIFKSQGSYHTKQFIESEINRLNDIVIDKKQEIEIIEIAINNYQLSINIKQ